MTAPRSSNSRSRATSASPRLKCPKKRFAKTLKKRLKRGTIAEFRFGALDDDGTDSGESPSPFEDPTRNPYWPDLFEELHGYAEPTFFPRIDLESHFALGYGSFNDNGSFAEMLRLNLLFLPTAGPLQDPLTFLGTDAVGYPNGRRVGDDNVDVVVRVAMGAFLGPTFAPDGTLPFGDGVSGAQIFEDKFPYLGN